MRGGGLLPFVFLAACAHTVQRSAGNNGGGDPGVYETHPYWINFVPFGAGQLQNHDTTKGLSLAIVEGTTAATSLGIWLYLTVHYRGTYVPINEASRVRLMQRIEIGSGVAFLGLYALGVVDSVLHYQPRVKVRGVTVTITPHVDSIGLGFVATWAH